jgi:hypothetical protein
MFQWIRRRQARQQRAPGPGPDVILDVVFDDGLFFLCVRNIGEKPAYKVLVNFDERILGLDGTREISALPLFRNIEFLAPGREIRTFLDSSSAYFGRGEPEHITAKVSFQGDDGTIHTRTLHHGLEIYKSIGYVRRAAE